MPINPANWLSPLSPIKPIQPLDFGGGSSSMERQKLQLLKQQFEETKRKNKLDEELDRLRMAGEMRRAELAVEKQKQQAAFLAAAELRKQQETAYADFYKAQDNRDFAGMATAAERLRAHGGLADPMGEDAEGRPSYRVAPSAEEYNQEEAALAAQAAPGAPIEPVDESQYGSMEEGMSAPSGPRDEPLATSLNRLNALGYDNANRRVVDTGELVDTSRAQMGPVMQGIRGSIPPGIYRDSVDQTIAGVQSLGLGHDKATELFGKLRGLADPILGKGLDLEKDAARLAFDREKFDADQESDAARLELDRDKLDLEREKNEQAGMPKPLTEKQKLDERNRGRTDAASTWKDRGLNNPLQAKKSGQMVIDLLEDKESSNDRMVAFYLVDMLGSRGPQSNSDVNIVLGIDALATKEQVREAWNRILEGGFSDPRRKALIDVIRKSQAEDDHRMYEYLDIAAEQLQDAESHPEYLRGWRTFLHTVPIAVRNEWDKARKEDGLPTSAELFQQAAEAAEASGTTTSRASGVDDDDAGGGEVDSEFLQKLYAAGDEKNVDPKKMLAVTLPESGHDPQAKNQLGSSARGIPQFIDDTAKRYVNPRTGKKFKDADEFATLSAAEQAPIMAQYFADSGVTKDSPEGDYALALAAPGYVGKSKRRDLVIWQYRSGTPQGDRARAKNPGWIPADGGEITVGSIIDFYSKHARSGPKQAKPTDESVAAAYEAKQAARAPVAAEEEEAPEAPDSNVNLGRGEWSVDIGEATVEEADDDYDTLRNLFK